MKNLSLTLLLITAILGGETGASFASSAPSQSKPENHLSPMDEDDIREAVFRYQFMHSASALQQNAKVYFLVLGKDSDPSDLFMLRFKDHKPPVKKNSRAMRRWDVIDKGTSEGGIRFYITSIMQVNEDEVEVEGGYYEGALSSSGNTYTVKRIANKWTVTEDKLLWISRLSYPANKRLQRTRLKVALVVI